MIQIFEACLKHMDRVFFDFDVEELSEELFGNNINFLFKLWDVAKKKASYPNED